MESYSLVSTLLVLQSLFCENFLINLGVIWQPKTNDIVKMFIAKQQFEYHLPTPPPPVLFHFGWDLCIHLIEMPPGKKNVNKILFFKIPGDYKSETKVLIKN